MASIGLLVSVRENGGQPGPSNPVACCGLTSHSSRRRFAARLHSGVRWQSIDVRLSGTGSHCCDVTTTSRCLTSFGHPARSKPSAKERDRMRYLPLAVAVCVLAACGASQAKQVVAQAAPKPASACDTGASPLLVVDGVLQAASCGRSKPDTTLQCRADAPLYVIDGVTTCSRP